MFSNIESEVSTDTWTEIAAMSTARKHLGCAVYNEHIYAVGGRDDATELNSVERYSDKVAKSVIEILRDSFDFKLLRTINGLLLSRCKPSVRALVWRSLAANCWP